jgi:two-component system, chemotaxis family, sensor histidine kinase and response regulator PixL
MDREQQIRLNFLIEAEEYLDQMESVLLNNPDRQGLDLALRAAHSVKGGAGMMGFTSLSQVAHRLEDFFKILRLGDHGLTIEVETLLLTGVDRLRQIASLNQRGQDVDEVFLKSQIAPIFEKLGQILGKLSEEDENALLNEDSGLELQLFEEEVDRLLDEFEVQLNNSAPADLSEILIIKCEELMVFSQMADLENFTQLCQSIQEQTLITQVDDLPELAQQALTTWRRSHALVCRGSIDKIPDKISIDSEELSEVNFDLIESFDLELSEINAEFATFDEDTLKVIENELIENLALPEFQKEEKIQSVTPVKVAEQAQMIKVSALKLSQFNNLFGKLIRERNAVNAKLEELTNFADLLRERMQKLESSQDQLRKWYDRASVENLITMANTTASSGGRTIAHFDTLEMDRYTDLHLISQAQIETIVQLKEVSTDIDLGLVDLQSAMGELNQTTKALQGNITHTNMTAFGDVVKMFPRLVRDLCLQYNKQVRLKIEGQASLIDRAVLDIINAPLTHLLRNAFDHGIESPEIRRQNGKPPEGTIIIKAVNRSNQTIITIQDDGGGIPVGKIGVPQRGSLWDRLVKQGIPRQQVEQMSESEILNYIFEAGFSTKDKVTELSGRGVGMDVVRTNLQQIRGDIQVDTKAGLGTTFTIKIPFSLSILRVMLLERAGLIFAIPVNSIQEVRGDTDSVISQLEWNEQLIPLLRLEEYLSFNRVHKFFPLKENPLINKSTILIVGEAEKVAGLYLDRIWGEQEVTIYPINTPISLPRGFNSSIILGDGRVIPLVDPVDLIAGCLEKTANFPVSNSSKSIYQQIENTILIVDDSINVRNYLALTLERAGYQVEAAQDGQEAVDKLFNGLSVQAVISDVEMPRLDGYGLLEEVRGKIEFQDLPIIMLTSRSNEKHRKLAFNLGANAYFSKPYNEQQLLQELSGLINRCKTFN